MLPGRGESLVERAAKPALPTHELRAIGEMDQAVMTFQSKYMSPVDEGTTCIGSLSMPVPLPACITICPLFHSLVMNH